MLMSYFNFFHIFIPRGYHVPTRGYERLHDFSCFLIIAPAVPLTNQHGLSVFTMGIQTLGAQISDSKLTVGPRYFVHVILFVFPPNYLADNTNWLLAPNLEFLSSKHFVYENITIL